MSCKPKKSELLPFVSIQFRRQLLLDLLLLHQRKFQGWDGFSQTLFSSTWVVQVFTHSLQLHLCFNFSRSWVRILYDWNLTIILHIPDSAIWRCHFYRRQLLVSEEGWHDIELQLAGFGCPEVVIFEMLGTNGISFRRLPQSLAISYVNPLSERNDPTLPQWWVLRKPETKGIEKWDKIFRRRYATISTRYLELLLQSYPIYFLFLNKKTVSSKGFHCVHQSDLFGNLKELYMYTVNPLT